MTTLPFVEERRHERLAFGHLHRARDHDPAAARRPSPTGECNANLSAKHFSESSIDVTVEPELAETVGILFTTPAYQSARRHQG
jgi:hypothetical protein